MPNVHEPVMLPEVIEYLQPGWQSIQPCEVFDGTLGGGGYSKAILDQSTHIHLTGCDLDPVAIQNFWEYTALPDSDRHRVTLLNTDFVHATSTLADDSLSAAVLDLGFSSNQLQERKLGFSYLPAMADQPFDLRFNPELGSPAFELIKKLIKPQDLGRIIYHNSGENLAQRIGLAIFDVCKQKQYDRSGELQPTTVGEIVQAIEAVIPINLRLKRNAIFSRVWQALRIWTNHEFEQINQFLPIVFQKLRPGGRLVIVSFHSLEDKLVAHWMRTAAEGETNEIYGTKTYYATLITRKAITASEAEVAANPRSRSAILRCLEKL